MLTGTSITQWDQNSLTENGLFMLYSSQKWGKDHKGTMAYVQKKRLINSIQDNGYLSANIKGTM